jgi:hypothetical protein
MVDVFAVAELLVAEVRRSYAQEVAVIVYYGSYATGAPSPTSDLDMYYIPDDGKAGALYRSFSIAGLPFEFWPVSWSFAERIATGKHRWAVAPSIIANAQVLYTRSPEDAARYQALRDEIAARQTSAQRGAMIGQALEVLKTASFYLHQVMLACASGGLLAARWAGCALVEYALDILALLNQTTFARNWASQPEQLQQLATRPARMEELIRTIVLSADLDALRAAAETLLAETRALVLREQRALRQPGASHAEVFSGYYPAIVEYVNKIVSAAGKGNALGASMVASQMQREMAQLLAQAEESWSPGEANLYDEYATAYTALGFPDLAPLVAAGDLAALAAQACAFQEHARAYFTRNGVSLNCVETMEALRAWIAHPS